MHDGDESNQILTLQKKMAEKRKQCPSLTCGAQAEAANIWVLRFSEKERREWQKDI